MMQIFKMAFRDLGRNRRRSFFSALAVGGGLALLILMASVVEGEMGSAIEYAIKLQTGHIQIRAATYDENKSSLKWEDLVANPDEIAAKIAALDQVKAATPRLYASGFLSSGTQSAGAKITGIDPLSPASDPYREGIISGNYLSPDDRDAVLIGRPMAEKLKLESWRQRRPLAQHRRWQCAGSNFYREGNLHHQHVWVRQRDRFPAACKSAGDDADGKSRQHSFCAAQRYDDD